MDKEQEKMDSVAAWYAQGINAGFTIEQLDFLKNYFAFWNDVPKQLDDLL